jgi:hypothetical protein
MPMLASKGISKASRTHTLFPSLTAIAVNQDFWLESCTGPTHLLQNSGSPRFNLLVKDENLKVCHPCVVVIVI